MLPGESTVLGLKNMDRALTCLSPAASRPGEGNTLLADLYQELLEQRGMWFWSVMKLIGGSIATRRTDGQGEGAPALVPPERQREAVQFLLNHAFVTSPRLQQPALLNRLHGAGAAVKQQGRDLLLALLLSARYERLQEVESQRPARAYPLGQFLRDVQNGLWKELSERRPRIDPYRRELQRVYLKRLKSQLSGPDESSGGDDEVEEDVTAFEQVEELDESDSPTASARDIDFPATASPVLRELSRRIRAALPRSGDAVTRAHLRRCLREVGALLSSSPD